MPSNYSGRGGGPKKHDGKIADKVRESSHGIVFGTEILIPMYRRVDSVAAHGRPLVGHGSVVKTDMESASSQAQCFGLGR